MSDWERLHKEHLEDEAYGKNEGRSKEIEICRQRRENERKEKAVVKMQKEKEEEELI
jgi:hypothetical protein